MSDGDKPLFQDATREKLGLTHIDRYEVQEQIGIGAMGVVYRVHDPVFACDRALKILRPELVSEDDTIQRFRDEGRAAVRASGEIAHANIITVYDVGDFDGRPYIVMELFRGIALDAVIEAERDLGLLKILQIGKQLASALESAHMHGVVHRDIKPGNVLLSEDAGVAKLTDFSVAQMKVGAGQSSLTRTGVVIGAPRYMPPEQALGKEVDGRSDLYGLGIMLYEMLTEQKAYQSETFTALLIEISQSELKPIKSIKKDVPPGVIAIVNKLVEKDPARRFQSAADLRFALEREIRDYTLEQMKGERRLPMELLGAGLLSLLVAGLLGFTGFQLRNQQVDALEEQTSAIGLEYAGTFAEQIGVEYGRSGEDNARLLYQSQFNLGESDTSIAYQHVVLNNGRVLASTDTDIARSGRYEDVPVLRTISEPAELEAEGPLSRADLVQGVGGETFLQVTRDVMSGPARDRRKVGELHIGFPTDRIEEIGRITLMSMLLMTALITSLVGLLTFSIIRYFTAPLKRLRDTMQVLTTGDHGVRLPTDKSGVAGEAFRALNGVASSLGDYASSASLTPTEQFSLTAEELRQAATERAAALGAVLPGTDRAVPERPAPDDAAMEKWVLSGGDPVDYPADEADTPFEVEIPQNISADLAETPVDDRTVMIPLHDPLFEDSMVLPGDDVAESSVKGDVNAPAESDDALRIPEPETVPSVPEVDSAMDETGDIPVDDATRVFRMPDRD